MLWLSFPPVGWSLLAWIGLVPLSTLIRTPWRSKPIYRPALAGGVLFGLLAVQWIRYADDTGPSGYFGWWALATYMGVYFPLFLLAARVAVLRFRVPAILAVPVTWVGLEYFRSWFLTGFPWYFLAHTQHRWTTLIQFADLTGAYGISFLVALVNGWLTDVLTLPLKQPGPAGPQFTRGQIWRVAVVLALLTTAIAYGSIRIGIHEEKSGPLVLLIQTNIAQRVKDAPDQIEEIRRQYLSLLDQVSDIMKAKPPNERPSLVIWPETAYIFGLHSKFADRIPLLMIAEETTDEDLRQLFPDSQVDIKKVRQIAALVRTDLAESARWLGVPVLMGLNTEYLSKGARKLYNSALLVTTAGEILPPYHKIHLVPWGEYLPLRQWLPWLHIFTPHASADYGLEAGTEPKQLNWNGLRIGVLICFEDTVPWAARSYMESQPVDLLVNLTNDGWFGVADESSGRASLFQRAEHETHLAISVFRAIECRRPLVRAVNSGITAIIDSNGHVVKAAGGNTGRLGMASEIVVGDVPLDQRRSLHATAGDWLAVGCFALSAACLLSGFVLAVQRRQARTD